jgi:hypothetical protein
MAAARAPDLLVEARIVGASRAIFSRCSDDREVPRHVCFAGED